MNNKEEKDKKIQEYYGMIYRFCFIQLKNISEAEDITQETFYKFLTADNHFDSLEQEKSWLFTVAINMCKNYWRSTWYKRIIPLFEDVSYKNGIEDEIVQKEEEGAILQTVLELPIKYRKVIHLFYYEKMSIKEIAKLTKVKESTIQTQLARGREILKKKLREDENELF